MGCGGGSGLKLLFDGSKETEKSGVSVAIVVYVSGSRWSSSRNVGFVVKGGGTKQQVSIVSGEVSTRLEVFRHGAPNGSGADGSDGRREFKREGGAAAAGGELLQGGKQSLLAELGCGQAGQKERFGTSRRGQGFTPSGRVVLVKRISIARGGGRITRHDDHRGWVVVFVAQWGERHVCGGRGTMLVETATKRELMLRM